MPERPSADLEAMAAKLESTGDYRVLRRLEPRQDRTPPDGLALRQGLFVDVETTGLDPARDEIIELAMTPFTYGLDGEIYGVGECFAQLREPSRPIPPAITALTGIDDAMVLGRTIDIAEVSRLAATAALVIAHNAAFDRRFLERLSETFTTKAWACSMTQIDWAAEGFEGAKLAYLSMGAGFFYDRHRAENDCAAAIELLALTLPRSGRTGLGHLLERARSPTWRIWAENAPFELKDQLKARGYRWNAEAVGGPRAWYIDIEDGHRESELQFLSREVYLGEIDLPVRRVDAYDRFSERV